MQMQGPGFRYYYLLSPVLLMSLPLDSLGNPTSRANVDAWRYSSISHSVVESLVLLGSEPEV